MKKNRKYQNNLTYSTDLKASLQDADLLIEAVPESIDIKKDFWKKLLSRRRKKPFLRATRPHFCRAD
jgi:3-hydroxybutyryl-CoA dehydrogenase